MNQPPPTETQTGKRIVSKGEYVRNLAGKTSLLLLCLIACLIYTKISVNLFRLFVSRPDGIPFFPTVLLLIVPVICFTGGLGMVYRLAQVAKQTDTGIPPTRANTADLPAPDSLVRASVEPVQEQQSVLLRAATETQERYKEQLVRASAGEPEA